MSFYAIRTVFAFISASMDCMLADELNSILQPLICSQCASLAAAEAAGKPKRRSSRRAPAHEEQPEENQSPPTVVGMRRVPLQSSDTTQKEVTTAVGFLAPCYTYNVLADPVSLLVPLLLALISVKNPWISLRLAVWGAKNWAEKTRNHAFAMVKTV